MPGPSPSCSSGRARTRRWPCFAIRDAFEVACRACWARRVDAPDRSEPIASRRAPVCHESWRGDRAGPARRHRGCVRYDATLKALAGLRWGWSRRPCWPISCRSTGPDGVAVGLDVWGRARLLPWFHDHVDWDAALLALSVGPAGGPGHPDRSWRWSWRAGKARHRSRWRLGPFFSMDVMPAALEPLRATVREMVRQCRQHPIRTAPPRPLADLVQAAPLSRSRPAKSAQRRKDQPMIRKPAVGSFPGRTCGRQWAAPHQGDPMAKYLLLKHYRRSPDPRTRDIPMEQWTPEEIDAHMAFMERRSPTGWSERGEFVDGQALSPEGTFVRYDGEGSPPVTDGPFAETKDLIAGWMVIDVDSYERAVELAGDPVRRARPERRADLRVARGPAVPRPTPPRSPSDGPVDDDRCCGTSPRGPGRPRPSRSRLRDGRGRRPGSAASAVQTWPDEPPRDPKGWLVTVAWRKFLDLARSDTAGAAREERVARRAGPGSRPRPPTTPSRCSCAARTRR